MSRAAIVGASGYIGGELLRLLLGHPEVEVAAATSTRLAGKRVDGVHPNLRSLTDLVFIPPERLDQYDVLFLAVPHKESMGRLAHYAQLAKLLVDLTGDFRLADPEVFERYYGVPHSAPDQLGTFVRGLPESHREELRGADRISVPGCMATAAILAVWPLAVDGLITGEVSVDARTGSSGSGTSAVQGNLHAERSGVLRVYAPYGHRHEAEISQATGMPVRMTATGIDAVRGVQVLCRVRLADGVDERAVRACYQRHYTDEPFVRVVAQRRGHYRLPEPKILVGSNFCDVGFAVDGSRALLVGALDNLVKGGAGGAVQAMNVRQGWPERLGLEFPGLHPV
ncbi:N-acetyl-gamma-glutamyl-phosphate reductase [Actinocrispum wychmicini]|uniref:N-acetyl-gamma-glutamyl-phosphate reductase n=1 Tax=Actinocrispum wychmicini TaxID=1213861 RepID=A0A4R2JA07_9PSEU|nr:N-acetyl-gamma-glutamyl-phosphate reductase [Actinocrispum wychmicini]TCO55594.1 N-acetyl-gamma-glutamyl-phosphate reductase [Actinocrispum wychmicini]